MITGASSGIGAAAARAFAAEGAAVILMARRNDKLEHHARLVRESGGEALCVAGDVTDSSDVQRAVDQARDTYGRLDAAFNNAGWASSGTPLHKMEDTDYDRIMDVNVRGVWNCLRAQITAMFETGTRGAIVNTSSVAGLRATGTAAPYIAAKHAVLGLTRAAADEYGPHGIRVNALVVGSTHTELMDEVLTQTPSLYEPFTSRAIQRRLADPLEVAQAALWLCSDRSSFTTGAAIPVDGGWTAR
ncbi:glucose 1-dehydrogenase [Streptomyces sp. NPDC016172]|uniref:glucose 1-dehydrogenase n=1 Tax=Streptomyces sp. NPDC016172 TaxID=3364964 RepID=UPI003702F3CE